MGGIDGRKIIHIDMDCFYAAIEVRDDPTLAGKPIAVSGDSSRSVVSTASYEARVYGVRSAMPVFMARERCPQLIVVPHRFGVYKAESRRIRAIFREYTDLVEPLSLDEAYLDVSHHERYGWKLAREIRRRIWEETRLTASAGIAPNKMLAKIASDWRKPNGQFAVTPDQVQEFMQALPVRKIHGVGPVATQRLKEMGIEICGQLQALEKYELSLRFGKWGEELYELARGIDDRPVRPHRIPKSLSTERTYEQDLGSIEECESAMVPLFTELQEDLGNRRSGLPIRGLFVKVKFANFQSTTRECPGEAPDFDTYLHLMREAFSRSPHKARLLGLGVRFHSPETPDERQMEMVF